MQMGSPFARRFLLTLLILFLAASSASCGAVAITPPGTSATLPTSSPPSVTRGPSVAAGSPSPSPFGPAAPTATYIPGSLGPWSQVYALSLYFADAASGWLLATAASSQGQQSGLILLATHDGGESWSLLADLSSFSTPGALGVTHLAFADAQNGWAYGPGLLATHDGGRTWAKETIPGDVLSLAPAPGSAWALVRDCSGSSCVLALRVSAVPDWGWRPTSSPPSLPAGQGEILWADAQTGWIAASGDQTPYNALQVTHDGGLTWSALPDPTADGYCAVRLLASSDPEHLWMICGGIPATIMMEKQLYASADGGQTWALVASAGIPVGTPSADSLPISGHINAMVFPTPQEGFLALGRGLLFRTADGGRMWKDVLPADPGELEALGGVGDVFFRSGKVGWAIAQRLVFRTTDGGQSWESATLP